jgi:SH3-like domain-containing protein
MRMARGHTILGAALLIALLASPMSAPAAAIEFRTVSDDAAILYDGPTVNSTKLYVVNKGYPLEVVVAVDGWVKVRDGRGAFSWIEAAKLTDRRTVMVKVPLADVRAQPDDAAPVAFQAQESVLLDVVGVAGGWVQVRHRDGATGFVRAQQVWGA